MTSASILIEELRARGITLEALDDGLQVRGKKGALTPELRDQISRMKPELLKILNSPRSASASPGSSIVTIDRSRPIPLAFGQESLIVLEQAVPSGGAYNMLIALRLQGALQVDALRAGLRALIERHESLRTTLAELDGEWNQVLHDRIEVHFPLVEAGADALDLEGLVQEIAQRPFDLTKGPLIRATLFRLSDSEHVLALVVHHLVADGWSLGILRRELFEAYDARISGRPNALPELPIQFADYAVWERENAKRDSFGPSLGYWKQTLSSAKGLIELPLDRKRPDHPTYQGGRIRVELSPAASLRFLEMCKRESASLFMGALAAFELVLYRHTGEEDIVIGTPFALRTRPAFEGIVGNMVNTIALRTSLGGSPTARELIARVRETAFSAFEHADVPFQQIVRELNPDRDSSHNPIYQVLFSLDPPEKEVGCAGLVISPYRVDSERAQLDLSLTLYEVSGRIEGRMTYNSDIFDRDTVARMVRHFERALTEFALDLDRPLADISLLDAAERELLLVKWNDTRAAFERERCVHQLFERAAAQYAASTAVTLPATAESAVQSLRYRELEAAANQLAHALQRRGVRAGDLVGLCLERTPALLAAMLGVWKLGAAYVPLDPHFPHERLAYMVEDSGIRTLVTSAALQAELPLQAEVLLRLDADAESIAAESQAPPQGQLSSASRAYVIYTSGSTGRPKGVEIPHRAVVNFLQSMARTPGLSASDRLLAVTTLSFDIAVLELLLPLTVGAEVVLARREDAYDGTRLVQLLSEHKVSAMQATPATWRLLLEAGWTGSRGLKALCGGEALPAELARQLVRRCGSLWNMYGPTETTIWSTLSRIEPEFERITIGRPIANTQAYVLDAQRRPLPIGAPGELYLGGDGLALGYLRRAELTIERFVRHPFSTDPSARLYRTGDLARWLPSGELECLGRVDFQIKLRGFRIELGEIESVLEEQPGVQQAVVVVRGASEADKRLVAYVRGDALSPPAVLPSATALPSAAALRDALRQRLPDYMVPSAYVVLEQFPLTPNGKVDRKALPEPDLGAALAGTDETAPRNATERAVHEIWCRLLGLERVGVHTDFFDVGGHSLLGLRMMAEINRHCAANLQPVAFFETPTIAGLASLIAPGPKSSAQRITEEAPLPPSWAADQPAPHENVPRADFEAVKKAVDSARSSPTHTSDRPYRMREAWIAKYILAPLYAIKRGGVRALIEKLIYKLEGGQAHTITLRKLYNKYYEIEIGHYSFGFFKFGTVKRGTRVGRYSVLTETGRIETANHPGNTFSSNAFFYNPSLHFSSGFEIPRSRVEIGNDVFIGHNATILYPTQKIGDGAIIAAHAVVTEDVPPFAVVAGYPAQIVRYRFSKKMIAALLELKWWGASLEDLEPVRNEFCRPIEAKRVR